MAGKSILSGSISKPGALHKPLGIGIKKKPPVKKILASSSIIGKRK